MSTDPKRVKEIFLKAADLPAGPARAAFLDRACGGDAGLRGRVEVLLLSHDPDGSFLGTPAAVIPDPDHAATRAFTPGEEDTELEGDQPLTFLAPAGRPDSLGRIGHYEVLQVLGRGAFGIVLRAFDDVLRRVVAVKVLAPHLAATSPARKRFVREARSSAQVRHENVVQVYEVGEHPLPYLVMEFIPGETLQQRLDRIGPLDPADVVRIGRQVAEGLAAAHATDLIHRDIKPGNILLEGGQHKVKITDFGLARAADDASITQSGVVAGTPMYMAPEQAKGEHIDHRADLFSLGSVLYVMAAGRPPFRANSSVAVLKRVTEDTPRPIREVIPETPRWLCDIISKLHAKNPDDRFQSAREVADVLADCEAQLKANARVTDFSRIPRNKPPGGTPGRWKWLAAGVLLAALALGVSEAAGVTHLLRKPHPEVAAAPVEQPAVAPKNDPPPEPRPDQKSEPKPDPKPEPKATPAPPSDGRPADRRAADYVLSVGGVVRVNGDERDIRAPAELPSGEFRLTGVSLDGKEQVTDEGLANLKDCRNLESLNLAFTAVGDAGLAHLKGCTNLAGLDLRFTRPTDAGLEHLKDLKNLTYLNLTACDLVTDAGLAHLRGCAGLENVALDGTRVTDAGLVVVKEWKNLKELQIPGQPITDAGLAHLAGLPKLAELNLRDTKVTAKGIDELAKSLPKCRIAWDGGVVEPR